MAEKPRVLIVDDDEELRKLLSLTLANDGFSVETAGDGQQGLAKLQSFKPHVVLLDLVMPKLDGEAFLHWLDERGLRAGVVIMTAYWEKAAESGVRDDRNVLDVWAKPLRYAELKRDISALILKHRLMPASSIQDLL